MVLGKILVEKSIGERETEKTAVPSLIVYLLPARRSVVILLKLASLQSRS